MSRRNAPPFHHALHRKHALTSRRLFLAAYDVRHPKRLRRALHIIKGYACGGQKSAFECWLTSTDIMRLIDDMQASLDLDEDRFALVPIDPLSQPIALGIAVAPSDPDFFYFG